MMGRVTLRNLAAHKIRLVLTAVAVILGVAFVAGTLMFTDTMNKRFDELFSNISQDIAVDVRAKKVVGGDDDGMSAQPIPASVLETVKGVDGVKDPIGNVTGYAAVVGKDGKIVGTPQNGPPQIGVNLTRSAFYELTSGRAPRGPREVVIDEASAEKGGLAIGDTTQVITAGPPQRMKVVGLVDTGNMMGATVTAFDTPTAQRLLLKPGYFTDIEMKSAGPSEEELRDRVAAVLPDNLEAITGTELREEAQSDVAQIMGFFRTFLLVFALISIFVGAFIIFNTFSMLVAQRTRELALLRAIGAARAQVTRAVIGEAVAVGIVGSTLGLAAGAGLASLLQAQMGDAGEGGLVFTATPVIWSYAVGIVVTVVSAYFPARRAAKIPPVAAMRDDVALPQRSMRIRIALGSLLTAVGAGLIAAGLAGTGGNPAVPVGAGAFGVFVGIAMLAPVISVPVLRVLGAPAARLLGPPGRLARQNALRNPRRTAATAAALMIGLALITTVNVLGATMRASIDEQIDAQFGGDYLVQAQGAGGVNPEAQQKVRRTPGVVAASPAYDGQVKIDGKDVFYVAADAAVIVEAARLNIVSGRAASGPSDLMVDEGTAEDRGWKVGATVPVQFPDGETERLTLAGVYSRSDLIGPRLLSPEMHRRHTLNPTVGIMVVDTVRTDAAMRSALESAVSGYPNLEVADQASLKEDARGQVDGFVTFLTILLIMSVIERTREFGLLRAIGTSRRQLRHMIRLESIMIAVFGAVLGMGIGVAFGAALQRALADEGLGVLSIPYGTLVLYLGVAAVIGVLAALWPAWRAGRMDVLKAISTE